MYCFSLLSSPFSPLCLSNIIWLYSPLLDHGVFFGFLILLVYTAGRTSWTRDQPSRGRYLHTEQHKHRINAYRYSCLEWNSKPRFQRSRERLCGLCDRHVLYIYTHMHTSIYTQRWGFTLMQRKAAQFRDLHNSSNDKLNFLSHYVFVLQLVSAVLQRIPPNMAKL
jgi:hypothetical protein